MENLGQKKMPARCFVSSRDKFMLRFGSYLWRFHLAFDWTRNNKQKFSLVFTVLWETLTFSCSFGEMEMMGVTNKKNLFLPTLSTVVQHRRDFQRSRKKLGKD